ncbi:response regulator transcription factor [Streptomyces inhibens]|uniref:response regulator transcription factor n=1 Tax=Streptomyces inhibens TaxID=2293571 RepID=UPI00402A6F8C
MVNVESPGGRPEPVPEPMPPPDLPRILLVDDDPAVLRSFEMLLSRRGFTVLCAADGTEALDAVQRLSPAAIVLDIEMRGLDGLTICHRIRAAGDRVPILMLSVRRSVGDRVSGLDAGADDHLSKPVAGDELVAGLRARLIRTVRGVGYVLGARA